MGQNLISEATVLEEIKKAIGETLKIDPGTIQPEHSIMNDLGADSLDFLDINYRLEQVFGVKMARHLVLEHIEDMFGEGTAIDENSQLTDKGVALLQVRLGDNLPVELRPGMEMDEIPPLVTVQAMVKGTMDILDSLPEKCGSCGKAGWKSKSPVQIQCGACEAEATFTDGDTLIKAWLKKIQDEKKIF
jgi:acyl carrier protein